MEKILGELAEIREKVQQVLPSSESILTLAREFPDNHDFLYSGRGCRFPTALGGAPKQKGALPIHAEWYPVAAMKPGSGALTDENAPVAVAAFMDSTYKQGLSNLPAEQDRKGKSPYGG